MRGIQSYRHCYNAVTSIISVYLKRVIRGISIIHMYNTGYEGDNKNSNIVLYTVNPICRIRSYQQRPIRHTDVSKYVPVIMYVQSWITDTQYIHVSERLMLHAIIECRYVRTNTQYLYVTYIKYHNNIIMTHRNKTLIHYIRETFLHEGPIHILL